MQASILLVKFRFIISDLFSLIIPQKQGELKCKKHATGCYDLFVRWKFLSFKSNFWICGRYLVNPVKLSLSILTMQPPQCETRSCFEIGKTPCLNVFQILLLVYRIMMVSTSRLFFSFVQDSRWTRCFSEQVRVLNPLFRMLVCLWRVAMDSSLIDSLESTQ